MLYLKASTDIEVLNSFKGEQGKFIKTFAFNTKRNKNGWRVTWDSIKKRIADFLDKPGIEFVKCEGSVCDLDHTEGETFEQALEIQEEFRVTNIADYILDEVNETAFFIHKSLDDAFFEKVKNREIKAVSPQIWPIPGEFVILGENEKGLPKIDVFDWRAVHDAFVNEPAFGDDAKITATCEGEGCHMKLLTAKELKSLSAEVDELAPLKEVPLLVRHKNKLRFVSVSKKIADKIYAKIQAGEILNEKLLTDTIKEIENGSDDASNTSFSSCTCPSKLNMTLNEEEIKKLQDSKKATEEKLKELESKLKATEEEKEKLQGKLKAAEEDDEKQLKEAKATTELLDKENKDLRAKVSEPIITSMLKARKQKGATEDQLKQVEKSLRAKSINELEERYNDEQIFMNDSTLSASEKQFQGKHFEFNGGSNPTGPLSAKSLETVFDEEGSQ